MKRSPLNKVSKKGATRHRAYMKVRKAYLEEHPICEVCGDRMATQLHHVRGRQGVRLCEVENFLTVCSGCHDEIHSFPEWAKANGYMRDRLAK